MHQFFKIRYERTRKLIFILENTIAIVKGIALSRIKHISLFVVHWQFHVMCKQVLSETLDENLHRDGVSLTLLYKKR